jgi:hypothetical protein
VSSRTTSSSETRATASVTWGRYTKAVSNLGSCSGISGDAEPAPVSHKPRDPSCRPLGE